MGFNPGGSNSSSVSGSNDVAINNITDTQVLAYDTSLAKWRNQTPPTAQDATSSAAGRVRLAGDLAGTATNPTVPGLRVADANIFWDGTGQCPLRSTATSDMQRRVRWISPVSPPTTTGYALTGDVWEAIS